jgi:hypothetical protein
MAIPKVEHSFTRKLPGVAVLLIVGILVTGCLILGCRVTDLEFRIREAAIKDYGVYSNVHPVVPTPNLP